MTKRLSPERIAKIREWWNGESCDEVFISASEDVASILGHIEAIEAELQAANHWCGVAQENGDETSMHWYEEFCRSQRELAEAKAELSRLRGLSDLGWDVTERGKLEAQIRDLGTLLRNENENYRRVNQELEEAKAEIARLEAELDEARDNGRYE